jgi:hypothetical protein
MRRLVPISAMAGVLVATVVGSALAMPGHHAPRTAHTPRPVPSWTPAVPTPGWHEVRAARPACPRWPSGTHDDASFTAVAATGPADAWAVGQCGPAGNENADADAVPVGVVEHWDGRRWSQMNVPRAKGYETVAALSATDVWAAGGGNVIHWDGRQWSSALQGLPAGGRPFRVAASSPAGVWNFDGFDLYHWDGRRWHRLDLPAGWKVADIDTKITAGASGDLWVKAMCTRLDEGGATGTIRDAHYDGHRWTFLPSPPHGYTMDRIAVLGHDAWAILDRLSSTSTADRLVVARWTGTRWAPATPPLNLAVAQPADLTGDGHGGLWVLADAAEYGETDHWDGSRWAVHRLPHPLHEPTATVQALAHVPGGSTIWGVGRYGANDDDDGRPFIETT